MTKTWRISADNWHAYCVAWSMSKYRTLDDGPVTEFSIYRVDVKRTRSDANVAVHTGSEAYAHLRKVSPTAEALPVTVKWIARLPRPIRPVNLLRRFPRVANMLAASWSDRESFRTTLYDLLAPTRQNHRGFPSDVIAELLTLRSYFENHL